MKLVNSSKYITLIMIALFFMACGSDDNGGSDDTDDIASDDGTDDGTDDDSGVVDGGITMLFKTTGGADAPEFVFNSTSLSEGTVSAEDVGFESPDWNYAHRVGSSLFVIGSSAGGTAQVYQENDEGEIEEVSSFQLDFPIATFGKADDETALAIDVSFTAVHNDRNIYTINAETGLIEDIVSFSIFDVNTGTPGEGVTAWPLGMEVVGDKLFVPFQSLADDGSFVTPDADTAKIAVFSYPIEEGDAPEQIITSTQTGELGANGFTAIVQADNGDLYTYSCGAYLAGILPPSTRSSGILKIDNGTTAFNEDYFLDVEALTGGKLFWMDYVGDNKVLARIITEDVDPTTDPDFNFWFGAYGRAVFNQKLVIIDLAGETVTDVANIPLHAKRYTATGLEEIDGLYYVSIETEDSAYIYTIDIDTATGTQGAEIEGRTIKGFFDL